jgi:hypothetical protein
MLLGVEFHARRNLEIFLVRGSLTSIHPKDPMTKDDVEGLFSFLAVAPGESNPRRLENDK